MGIQKNLKTIELFSGIGGFRIAAEKRGIKTIWANDIDEIASKAYVGAFGEKGYHKGDIWKLIESTPSHDLLTGGFPCQPFSAAGKKRGIEDPRGTLFEAIIKILEKHQPEYFILENVKRLLLMEDGKHFATILAALSKLDYRIEWRLLNARNFGLPQNRQRIVITGRHLRKFKELNLDPTSNLAIKLASPEELVFEIPSYEHWSEIENHSKSFANWGVAYEGKFYGQQLTSFLDAQGKVLLRDVIQQDASPIFDLTESTIKRLDGSRIVEKFVEGVEILSNQAGGARMGYTIFGTDGLAPTLTSSTSRHYERYKIGDRYRRLTNVEYARIQGFPDSHCAEISLRHQYVLYGNAVPPPLVGWVMDKLLT